MSQSYMVPPESDTYATLTEGVTMIRPLDGADAFSLMLVQLGAIPLDEAVSLGLVESDDIPAGTVGRVVEMCAGSCPHFLETGTPCAYVVEITTPGKWEGVQVVVTGEQATVTVTDAHEWTVSDDDQFAAFLRDWDANLSGGADDYATDFGPDDDGPWN